MELFKLVGKIFIDSDEANKSISKTGDEADGLGNKLSNGLKTAGKWAAGVAAAATAVGGAMVKAAKSTAEDLDVIDKASQRMGIAAESYQELAYAANLSGVNMTSMEKAAKSLVGTDLSLDDALDQIMSIGDETERTQAAIELFGEKVAYDMQPLLNAGAEGFADMKKEANDLGLVMSQDTVSAGATMNDMFSKVKSSISTMKNQLVSDFMPYVMEILQWLIDNLPDIIETVKGIVDKIMPIVKPVLDAVMALLPPLLDAIKRFLDWIMPYLLPIIDTISGVVESFLRLINGDIDGFIDGIKTTLKNFAKKALELGKEIFTSLWDGIKSVWENISSWISDKISWLGDKLAFWRNGQSEIADGSHASGLAFVPYDGYMAELHRGETVLNSTDASQLLEQMKGIASGGGEQNINVTLNLDGAVLAQKLFKYNTREIARKGGSLVGGVA